MSVTITANNGGGTATPLLILMPYEYRYESRNIRHQLVGGGIAVSLVPADPRSGDMQLLFGGEAAARACGELHRQPTTFLLAWPEMPAGGMTYFVDGAVTVARDPTMTKWICTVTFQEVPV